MIDKIKIYNQVRDFLRAGPADEYQAKEWLETTKLTSSEYVALAQVLYDRNDIDADAVIEILIEAVGADAVNEWMKAFVTESIRPGRGEYPSITKEQTAKALILAFRREIIPGDSLEEQWRWIIYRLHDAIPDVDRVAELVRYAVQRIREVVDEDVSRPEPEPVEPDPEPEPIPPPEEPPPTPNPVDVFLYDPRGDTIHINVPRYMGVWKFNIFGRRRHAHLVEDLRGSGPFTIPMSGAQLRQMAIDNGEPDGSVMVYVNTTITATPPEKSAGWRIMDPRQRVEGDATRLLPGQNQ